MKHIKHIITALAACAITASAQVTLEIEHTEKSAFTSQSDVKLIQILKIAGQEIPTKSLQKITVKSTTGKRAANGTLNTLATFTQWAGQWNFPGGIEMKFSTDAPNAKAPLAELEPILEIVRTMVKHPTTQIYNKDGSLNKVTIPKAAHDGLEGPLKNEFNAKQISDSIKQEHGRLPNKAVSKGDTWVRKEVMPLGAGQVLNLRVDYTYEGIIEKNNQQPRSHHRQSHRRRLRNERPRRRPAHGKGQRPQSRQIKN